KFTLFFLSVFALSTTLASSQGLGSIERLDPSVNKIVPANAKIERVATGFKWTEGPIWIHAGYLLFAEIPSNSIRKWAPGKGVSIFMQPSGYLGKTPYKGPESGSNGMTLDPRGRLTVAGHAQRDVWRLESLSPHAVRTILAEKYHGKQLNSPNDLVYGPHGALYFTDPPYGLPTQSDSDPIKQLRVNGVYRIVDAASHRPGAPPDESKIQLLISDLTRPNGIAFSPDMKYLYVNNSEPKKLWMRYKVNPDGTVSEGKVFYDATSDSAEGAPDGMKVDREGNIYSAGPGGVWIFSPEGKHLATIHPPERVGNLNWGDSDGKTLYIMASTSIYRIRLSIPGVRP
ncbi:MAG: SMP-30/gluconolactonase/LRE family protein, partial [Candidatus Dormibacteraceae bacterium]